MPMFEPHTMRFSISSGREAAMCPIPNLSRTAESCISLSYGDAHAHRGGK
jgi:hypothetical protein